MGGFIFDYLEPVDSAYVDERERQLLQWVESEFEQKVTKGTLQFATAGDKSAELNRIKQQNSLSIRAQGQSWRFLKLKPNAPLAIQQLYNEKVKKSWQGIKQLFWRADSRPPDEIFKVGFPARNVVGPKDQMVPVWRENMAELDIETGSGPCIARKLEGAAFFPLNSDKASWLYLILLKEGYNSYWMQKEKKRQLDVLGQKKEGGDSPVWLFNEKVTCFVNKDDVIFGLPLERIIRDGNDPKSGIKFRVINDKRKPNGIINAARPTPEQVKGYATEIGKFRHWYPSDINGDTWLTYKGVKTTSELASEGGNVGAARGTLAQDVQLAAGQRIYLVPIEKNGTRSEIEIMAKGPLDARRLASAQGKVVGAIKEKPA